jgi:hypothetical protein
MSFFLGHSTAKSGFSFWGIRLEESTAKN